MMGLGTLTKHEVKVLVFCDLINGPFAFDVTHEFWEGQL